MSSWRYSCCRAFAVALAVGAAHGCSPEGDGEEVSDAPTDSATGAGASSSAASDAGETSGAQAACGDGALDPGEECDGRDRRFGAALWGFIALLQTETVWSSARINPETGEWVALTRRSSDGVIIVAGRTKPDHEAWVRAIVPPLSG